MESKGDIEVVVDGGPASTQEYPGGPMNNQGAPMPVPGPGPVPYSGPPPPQEAYPMYPPPVYTTTAQPIAGSVPPLPPGYVNTLVIRPGFTALPCNINCPNCNNAVTTVTHKEVGMMVWLMAGGMILLGLWLGCCLVPFCIDSLKDTVHTCPVCKHTVGKFTHM